MISYTSILYDNNLIYFLGGGLKALLNTRSILLLIKMSRNTLIDYNTFFGHDLIFLEIIPLEAPCVCMVLTTGQAYSLDVLNCIKELFIQASNSVQTWVNQLIADNVTREGCIGSRGVN